MTSAPCRTMMLRNREVATTMPDARVCCAHADVAAAMCVICQDAMNVPSAVATLECGHCFHNTCIISSICATMADAPFAATTPPSPTTSHRTTPSTTSPTSPSSAIYFSGGAQDRSSGCQATLRKWNDEVKAARKSMRDANDKLRLLEDAIEDKVEAYADKQWKRFNRKNKLVIEACTNSRIQATQQSQRLRRRHQASHCEETRLRSALSLVLAHE